MVRHSTTTDSNSASESFVFSCRFWVEFVLVVAWLVQASSLMEFPRRPPFLSFARQNKLPALTGTQSHVLLSDDIISKGLLCLFVVIYQINFILFFKKIPMYS